MSAASPTWTQLPRADAKEDTLQATFVAWPTRARSQMFGVPDWLERLTVEPVAQKQRTSYGYTFQPDIEFVDAGLRYVLELKYGVKYEPLALAEVLHHAAWLRRHEAAEASHVVPVVVSQFSSWLRLAVDEYLRGQVRLVEVDILKHGSSELYMFDAPLASWSPWEAPDWLIELTGGKEAAALLRWHYVAETSSWFGMRENHRTRPIIIDEPYVWLHRHDDGTMLVWEGHAPQLGERSRTAGSGCDLTSTGTYYLSASTGTGRATPGPTWLARVSTERVAPPR